MRTAIDIVEALLHGVRTRETTLAPLAPDVVLDGVPSRQRLAGDEVMTFLSRLAPLISEIRVERHIVEGPYVATMLVLEVETARISGFVCFRLSNGLIKEIRFFSGIGAPTYLVERAAHDDGMRTRTTST